jgi:hypothetical protein
MFAEEKNVSKTKKKSVPIFFAAIVTRELHLMNHKNNTDGCNWDTKEEKRIFYEQ